MVFAFDRARKGRSRRQLNSQPLSPVQLQLQRALVEKSWRDNELMVVWQQEKVEKDEDIFGILCRNSIMVTQRRPWWRSVPFFMLVIVLLLPLCRGKNERPIVSDRDMNRRKETCYIDIDNGLWGRSCRSSWISKENCALRCVSATCYNKFYGQDALEEGEVDYKRGREFRGCLKRELEDERKARK